MSDAQRHVKVALSYLDDVAALMDSLGPVTGFNTQVIFVESDVREKCTLALGELELAAGSGIDVTANRAHVYCLQGAAYSKLKRGIAGKTAAEKQYREWLSIQIDALEKSVSLMPTTIAYYELGFAYMDAARDADAIVAFRQVEELADDSDGRGIEATKLIRELESGGRAGGNAPAKSGCYIATACYGSYEHPDVLVLRRFRDERLLRSAAGRMLVRIYYASSPSVARRLGSTSLAAVVRRLVLEPLVRRLR